jgi:drug/metabolite transporter (DMT)-like permease
MNKPFYMGLFVACTFLSSCAQILLKKSANQNRRGFALYLNRKTLSGYFIFFGVTLAIVFLYRYIELSTGALLDSSSYIFIPVLSYIFLKERLNRRKITGIMFIVGGIVIYAVFGINS